MYTSRLCRDRAEELRPVHDWRLRKASSGEQLRNALLWLAGVDSEAERDVATMFEDALYLPQSRARIRPRLHRIDRERVAQPQGRPALRVSGKDAVRGREVR